MPHTRTCAASRPLLLYPICAHVRFLHTCARTGHGRRRGCRGARRQAGPGGTFHHPRLPFALGRPPDIISKGQRGLNSQSKQALLTASTQLRMPETLCLAPHISSSLPQTCVFTCPAELPDMPAKRHERAWHDFRSQASNAAVHGRSLPAETQRVAPVIRY